jgi:hypothetical protein
MLVLSNSRRCWGSILRSPAAWGSGGSLHSRLAMSNAVTLMLNISKGTTAVEANPRHLLVRCCKVPCRSNVQCNNRKKVSWCISKSRSMRTTSILNLETTALRFKAVGCISLESSIALLNFKKKKRKITKKSHQPIKSLIKKNVIKQGTKIKFRFLY